MANLNNVPLCYLRIISDLFELNSPKAVKEIINAEIEKREKPNYDGVTLKEMCELGIITVEEGAFLYVNKINNFKELLECNLDDLVGITPELKNRLEHQRRFYDVSRFMTYDAEELEVIDGPCKK